MDRVAPHLPQSREPSRCSPDGEHALCFCAHPRLLLHLPLSRFMEVLALVHQAGGHLPHL